MTNSNTIFASQNNSDNSTRLAKRIIGRLLISLRRDNLVRIYSLITELSDTKAVDGVIIARVTDNTLYQMLTEQTTAETVNQYLKTIDKGYRLQIELNTKDAFDYAKFKNFLAQEFGNILTIVE